MKSVPFVWWPWRVMSAGVPVVAAGVAVAVGGSDEFLERGVASTEQVRIFLGIYAGGTALLLGWAVGDFGRSLWAMAAGVVVGQLACPEEASAIWFLLPVVCLFVVGLLFATDHSYRRVLSAGFTCALGGLTFGFLAGVVMFLLPVLLSFRQQEVAIDTPIGLIGMAVSNLSAMAMIFPSLVRADEGSRGGIR